MAMSATITASLSTVLINQPTNLIINIANSGGSAVNVTGIQPTVIPTGATNASAGVGVPAISAGIPVSVPASGSLNFPFSVVFFAPSTGPIGAGNGTYSVGAVCESSDGSVFSPTAVTITVNPITLPTTEQ